MRKTSSTDKVKKEQQSVVIEVPKKKISEAEETVVKEAPKKKPEEKANVKENPVIIKVPKKKLQEKVAATVIKNEDEEPDQPEVPDDLLDIKNHNTTTQPENIEMQDQEDPEETSVDDKVPISMVEFTNLIEK